MENSELAFQYPLEVAEPTMYGEISEAAYPYPLHTREPLTSAIPSPLINALQTDLFFSSDRVIATRKKAFESRHIVFEFPLFEIIDTGIKTDVYRSWLNANIVYIVDTDGEPVVDDIFYSETFSDKNWQEMHGDNIIFPAGSNVPKSAVTMKKEELHVTHNFDGRKLMVRIRARKRRNRE